jgi:hypothetical protein
MLTAQLTLVAEAIRSIGVTEVTYDRWQSEYGGLKGDQIKRLKELEAENNRLWRAEPPSLNAIHAHFRRIILHEKARSLRVCIFLLRARTDITSAPPVGRRAPPMPPLRPPPRLVSLSLVAFTPSLGRVYA